MVTHNSRGRRPRNRRAGLPHAADVNVAAAGLLYDMAALQGNERSALGYKRAAKAVVALPAALAVVIKAGALRDVPFIGPASARILTEFVETGHSPTVDAAVEASRLKGEVLKQRMWRANFLSRHAMEEILAADLPATIVSKGRFRGDFQMHTTWSDGAENVETMIEACLSLGHSCMGVTDHSYGLPVARGMAMAAAHRQQQEIDELNREYAGRFRVFKGIEANILGDGSLDLQREERGTFDFVVASPHALLRRAEDQTPRMLAAVRAPAVAILGHPRGRVYNTRPGVTADWPRVFAAAAERGVAIELDGNWHRQDLDWELAALALAEGCIFALDSDAHSIPELRFTDYAIAHARLARIPADRVINCWGDQELEKWMERVAGSW